MAEPAPKGNKASNSGKAPLESHEAMVETARGGRPGWKRRRRSVEGIVKREGRRRKLAFVLLGIGLPLAGGCLLWAAAAYYRCESDAFRRELAGHLSEKFGLKVHVGLIEMRGLSLSVPNVSLSDGKGAVKYAELRGVRTTLAPASFLGRTWKVESLVVEEADVHFAPPEGGTADVRFERRGRRARVLSAGFGLSGNPGEWSVGDVHVRSLNVFWSGAEGGASSLQGTRVRTTGFSAGDEVRFTGGTFAAGGLPVMRLERAEGRLGREGFELTMAKLRRDGVESSAGEGTVEAAGFLQWAGAEEVALNIVLRDCAVQGLVAESWKSRLGGRLNAELEYKGELRGGNRGRLSGRFQIVDGWVAGLPLLDALADVSAESGFRKLHVDDEYSGEVVVDGGGISLAELHLEKAGLIRVTGGVAVARNGSVDGEFEIGLPEAMLKRLEGGKPDFFGIPEGGFCFARLVASGEIESPRENLSTVLLSTVARAQVAAAGPTRTPVDAAAPKSKPLMGKTHKARLEELFRALLEGGAQ